MTPNQVRDMYPAANMVNTRFWWWLINNMKTKSPWSTEGEWVFFTQWSPNLIKFKPPPTSHNDQQRHTAKILRNLPYPVILKTLPMFPWKKLWSTSTTQGMGLHDRAKPWWKSNHIKFYSLLLDKQVQLDTFITENLASGQTHHFKSPMASPCWKLYYLQTLCVYN